MKCCKLKVTIYVEYRWIMSKLLKRSLSLFLTILICFVLTSSIKKILLASKTPLYISSGVKYTKVNLDLPTEDGKYYLWLKIVELVRTHYKCKTNFTKRQIILTKY